DRDAFNYKFKPVMLLPIIIWAALGFNLRTTSVALLLAYGFSLFGLFSNAGRFPHNTLEDAVVYNIIIGAIGLCVAVVHEQRSRAYKNLTQSELNFKRAQRVVNMGSWQLDIRSMLFTGSDEVYAIFGLRRDGQPLTQEMLRNCIHPDDLAAMDAACQRSLRGEAYDMEQRIIVNGQTKWIRQTVVVDFDYAHKPVAVFGTVRDITRRKLTEENLRLAANVFEGSGEAILITDAEERIMSVNQAFIRMTGYVLDEIKGKNPRILSSGKHNAEFYRVMWEAIHSQGFWQGEILDRDKSGRIYPKWMSISAIKDEHGALTHYISIAADISERKTAEQNIQSLAYYDVLTALPNRTLLHDRLGQLIAASHRDKHQFALLFLDLDRFKYVNDSMGHGMGDKLLRVVAHHLQQCVREGDTVSRIGGDEFIVLLRETDADGAARVATKILAALAIPCDVGEVQIATHASIGISIYPDNAGDADTLVKHADLAMYRVKEEGRSNYQFFTPEMNFHADKLFSMEKDLRLALERKEFSLYYQPQMNLRYGRVCGAEALIRWHHPQKGLIEPAEFISVAEETGQIEPIGEWVLRTACAQLAEWRKQGMVVFPISVNLSIRQLRQPGLAQLVADILEEMGLGPHDLELEITEGIMMGETQTAMDFLTRMHALGVHLSIDDFGTGYSSLSYLKKMPIDRLKIDQSFVRDITTDENDAAIVRSVISLGHQLNLQVVAEGVETLEQVNFLRVRGCDEIQGHYFSHPLPVNEFAIFINSNPVLVEI
ncbi:MAG: EAL domain-containing protein, partial [Gallionellaceae bacterium]|nr:EAL domain-containing protein [Gallionellaceae bacterium]